MNDVIIMVLFMNAPFVIIIVVFVVSQPKLIMIMRLEIKFTEYSLEKFLVANIVVNMAPFYVCEEEKKKKKKK
jgi:hypothetical protein